MEPGQYPYQLSPKQVEEHVKQGTLDLPTRYEVEAKGQGDAFSKATALLQICWFVMQCLARPIQGLPLTKLEVIALSYTFVSVTMYSYWWSKPFSVSQPVRVRRHFNTSRSESTVPTVRDNHFRNQLANLFKIVIGAQDDDVDLGSGQIFLFYAGGAKESQILLADAAGLLFAMAFGAIHCAAWSFTFPSDVERLVWRVSSIALVILPVFFIALAAMYTFEVQGAKLRPLSYLSIILIPGYLLARMAVLILAVTTLRSLPPYG